MYTNKGFPLEVKWSHDLSAWCSAACHSVAVTLLSVQCWCVWLTWRHAGGPEPLVPGEPAGRPGPSPWLQLAAPPAGSQTPRRTAPGLRSATPTAAGVPSVHVRANAAFTISKCLWSGRRLTWKPLLLTSSSTTFHASSRTSSLGSTAAGFLGPRDLFLFTLFFCAGS